MLINVRNVVIYLSHFMKPAQTIAQISHFNVLFSEPTNMLDMKAIIWLENYLQVSLSRSVSVLKISKRLIL